MPTQQPSAHLGRLHLLDLVASALQRVTHNRFIKCVELHHIHTHAYTTHDIITIQITSHAPPRASAPEDLAGGALGLLKLGQEVPEVDASRRAHNDCTGSCGGCLPKAAACDDAVGCEHVHAEDGGVVEFVFGGAAAGDLVLAHNHCSRGKRGAFAKCNGGRFFF